MATTARVYIVMELVIGGGPLLDKIQSNLLLDADGVLRVSDFGMSALPQQARQDGLLHSACGALDYIAPEVIRNRGYEGKKADIWSCGAILFHLVAGYVPFRNEYDDRNTKIRQILQADFICPSFFSSSLITLIRRILDPNPTTRITMNEIFENEWFMQNYQPPRFFRQNFSFGHRVDKGDEAGSSAPPVPVMNAFEILNTFLGYNLIIGKLLNQLVQLKRETRFISQNPVDEIIDGIERVAGIMGFDVKKINNFRMSIEGGANARRKGHLSIFTKVHIFVRYIAQPFHMVELRKAEGDVLEFHNFCRHIYAALSDFIWKGRAEPMDTETDGSKEEGRRCWDSRGRDRIWFASFPLFLCTSPLHYFCL
ncbi:CBL-interacting serine/threonine-protein kinase 23 [Glycine soja]